MAAKHVQVLHDDGRWYVAELLDQHRSGGRWRAVVRYSVAPGMRYVRAEWADEFRRMDHEDMPDPVAILPSDSTVRRYKSSTMFLV
jgi:hypothetical protein